MSYVVIFTLVVAVVAVTSYYYKNRVITIGPFYYILRDNGALTDPLICKGFMNQLRAPWRKGKGLQVSYKTYTFQVGISKKYPNQEEDQGIMSAVGGRYLDTDTKDIREW
jgi:hypothetical protein